MFSKTTNNNDADDDKDDQRKITNKKKSPRKQKEKKPSLCLCVPFCSSFLPAAVRILFGLGKKSAARIPSYAPSSSPLLPGKPVSPPVKAAESS